VDWSLASKWFFKSGIRHTHIIGKLSTYMARENRTEVYHASRYQPGERFSLSINLRQLLYDGNWAPFAPSLGFEWAFWKTETQGLTGLGSVSRAFKVPTLNDRFWVPGGNPDILPEESWSGEFGLAHRFSKNKTTLSQTFTRYRMCVDNWIIWLPKGNIWSPENIRAVRNDGFEYHAHFEQVLTRDWKFELSGNYAWTRALQTAAATENDPGLGKQLPYTPEHKLQGLASMTKGNLRFFANQQWVSERFVTTDNLSTVAPYYLLDLGLQSQWHWGPLAGQAGFQINNLLDTEYQIMRLRAMPGRNYQFNLSIAL
jgi:vitamin B12 transporter